MVSIHEHATVEEASTALLAFALDPFNWVTPSPTSQDPTALPALDAQYQRRVGTLRICVAVEVLPSLEVFLRVAFRGPGLSPVRAADHLAAFLKDRLPLTPNTEWQVEVDERRWIHFVRRYAGQPMRA
jgi:hypothetical protein